MEDFERQYAEELLIEAEESAGLSSRRLLDLRSPLPQESCRKRRLSSESLLHAGSPDPPLKLQCLEASQDDIPATHSDPIPVTPSRPAVPFVRAHSVHKSENCVGTTGQESLTSNHDVTKSPLTPCTSLEHCQLDNSQIHSTSFTSFGGYSNNQKGVNSSSVGNGKASLTEKFNRVYQSLTAQTPAVNSETDAICSSGLRGSCVEVVPQSSGVLRRAPAGPHVTVTNSEGRRVYLAIRNSNDLSESSHSSIASGHLLPVSFSRLRAAVQEERRKRLIEQSEQLLHSLRSTVEESKPMLEDSKLNDREAAGAKLWVDKYAPRHYTHLLSDDGINRTLLSWMKLWDETVFGHSSLSTTSGDASKYSSKEKRGGGSSGSGAAPHGSTSGKRSFDGKREGKSHGAKGEWQELADSMFASEEALDETRRPKLKVALLCGAPGLGKTTLAHVIAQHAGYQAVEMNASDDRSADIFRQKLEATTQMQAVLTPERRPTCLIVDEIDGAPVAAINVLIELLKRKDSGKKKKKYKLLSRPVICICNDQYAPSLRQLKQFALILVFPPTLASRLASRLQQVIHQESMISSISTLMALCEKAENDIRACLNTLQFISREQQELTLGLVQSASVGQKDAQMSLFSLWKEIFQLPSAKRRPIGFAMETVNYQVGKEINAASARFYHMLSAASATGEYEKVCLGLFENYLSIHFRDPNLEAICVGLDWVVFHDVMQQHIAHTQNYAFWSYLPFLSVAFHFLFAAPSKPYIRYPHTNFEMFQKKQQTEHLLSSVVLEVPPHIRRMLTTTQLSVEILFLVLEIITPSFRSVSIQLYSAREKQQMADLIDTMISYGLTYKQEKGADGQYTYILDPCLEVVCRFPGLPQRKQLSYGAKQLIAREVEIEKMRRMERIHSGHISSPAGSELDKGSNLAVKHKEKGSIPRQKFREKPALDFFGRRLETPACRNGGILGGASHTEHALWFRFNEGFSNAVRRPVRIQDLL